MASEKALPMLTVIVFCSKTIKEFDFFEKIKQFLGGK